MDSPRVALVGVGRMARMHHLPALQRLGGNQLVGTCDLREERSLPGIPHYTDVRRLLADTAPDAVYVLTPPGAHMAPVSLALNFGCHVFCEMPPALEPLEAMEMVAFARETERSLVFGTNRHFAPTYRRVKEVTAGEPPQVTMLSKCRHALCDLSPEFAENLDAHYAEHFQTDGTPMFLFLTSFLEVAEWLNGPIATSDTTATPLLPGLRTDTRAVCHVQHENGAHSVITYDEFGPQVYEHVTLHSPGSTYILRGSMMQPNQLLVWKNNGPQVYPGPRDPLERGGFLEQSANFLRMVREDRVVYPDPVQLARLIHHARKADGSAWWQAELPVTV